MAFNAKNLQYNKQEPSFLRRLRGEVGGLDGRHNVQIARPKKDRLKTGDDEEDEPVIVDERGERIEKAELERRMKGGDETEQSAEKEAGAQAEEAKQNPEHSERQMVSRIGASANSKKRKVGKVVGGEDEDDRDSTVNKAPKQGTGPKEKDDKHPAAKIGPVAPKKKGKKIKLSFDDPDG
ncbi:uncharacterized protein Z519_08711 [Cladophialophora bantiana CBS 173.52]|uniref:DUF4604 domain-containing protein n=1 Tax=Cladophialophora bantiana (strain ATCC 10958 / CBS 173.52 / CDC B-1940 / NIH 8579) TaxID=1442370 RepID=A0A0D2HCC4_CLAB1|nr:uncharacterized protein Z519_08711 [Cladophialophora bantiana CBS 173.52]KIW90928.1 hypothetical protein Z519_08711 [Cladophialophora bantiana CBS 173.52]